MFGAVHYLYINKIGETMETSVDFSGNCGILLSAFYAEKFLQVFFRLRKMLKKVNI